MTTQDGVHLECTHRDASLPGRHRRAPLALAALILAAGPARAADSPYCEKVRARAGAEAALLSWPKLFAQGVRFPSTSDGDLGPTLGEHIQARFGVTFSPTDLYRGVHVSREAEADCDLHETSTRLGALVKGEADGTALPALRAQAAYLEAHRPEWRQLVAAAEEQLAAGVLTVIELHELRRALALLERKVEVARGELERLEALAPAVHQGALGGLGESFTQGAMRLEREASRARALDALRVSVSGGVVPSRQPLEWFALLEVSYSLGGLARGQHEERNLAAREEELRHAPSELPSLATERARVLRARRDQARRELKVVQDAQASVSGTRAALEQAQSSSVAAAKVLLALEQSSLEADRVFLETIVSTLTPSVAAP